MCKVLSLIFSIHGRNESQHWAHAQLQNPQCSDAATAAARFSRDRIRLDASSTPKSLALSAEQVGTQYQAALQSSPHRHSVLTALCIVMYLPFL